MSGPNIWTNILDEFQDGKGFLDKNLTDWKKPHLMEHFDGEEEEEEDSPTPPPAPAKGKKGKMAKHTTMKGTAKV